MNDFIYLGVLTPETILVGAVALLLSLYLLVAMLKPEKF